VENGSGGTLPQAAPRHKETRRSPSRSFQTHALHGGAREEAQQARTLLSQPQIRPRRMHQRQHRLFSNTLQTEPNPPPRRGDSALPGVGVGSKIVREASLSFLDHATEAHGKQSLRESLVFAPTLRRKNLLFQEPQKPAFLPGGPLEQNVLRGLRNHRVPEERMQRGAEPGGEVRGEFPVLHHASGVDMGGGAEQGNEALQRRVQQVLRQENE